MDDEKNSGRGGRLFVFWTWMTIIFGGLAVMIIIPLTGR
jgi:hypothetical protein